MTDRSRISGRAPESNSSHNAECSASGIPVHEDLDTESASSLLLSLQQRQGQSMVPQPCARSCSPVRALGVTHDRAHPLVRRRTLQEPARVSGDNEAKTTPTFAYTAFLFQTKIKPTSVFENQPYHNMSQSERVSRSYATYSLAGLSMDSRRIPSP